MLPRHQFDFDDPLTGMEIELNLVDDHGDPAMRNTEVLELIDDPAFQTELGRFNLEINVPPAASRRRPGWSASRTTYAASSTPPRPRRARPGPGWS